MCLYSQWQGNKNCAKSLFMVWHGLAYIYTSCILGLRNIMF